MYARFQSNSFHWQSSCFYPFLVGIVYGDIFQPVVIHNSSYHIYLSLLSYQLLFAELFELFFSIACQVHDFLSIETR
jgi:hypothetical protein